MLVTLRVQSVKRALTKMSLKQTINNPSLLPPPSPPQKKKKKWLLYMHDAMICSTDGNLNSPTLLSSMPTSLDDQRQKPQAK